MVIDLLWESCPKSCTNFIKLCKLKYFNYTPIPIIRKDKLVYLGDKPSGTNSSIWGFSSNKNSSKLFTPELQKPGSTDITFKERGTVAFTTIPSKGRDGFKHEDLLADSQFCITVTENYEPDTELAIFGNVVEGFETLDKLNNTVTDFSGKPLLPILILHSYVLDDPFEKEEDKIGVSYPEESPPPSPGQLELIEEAFNQDELSTGENKDNNIITSDNNRSVNTVKTKSDRDAAAQALTLEIIGDLPFAAVKPEENVLFVCKLNPVTQADDLELIFSRFGKILSCEVIRDPDTGDSLQYAFIEFDRQEDCERAYLKMEGVLIDDRRIHVDFSQSVSKLAGAWRNKSNEKRRFVHGARFQASTGSSRRNHQRSASPPHRDKKRDDNDQRSDRGYEFSRKDYYNDKYRSTSRQSDNDTYGRDRYNTSQNSDKSHHKISYRDRDDRRHYDKDIRSHRDKDHRSSHRDQDRYNSSSRDRSSGRDNKRDKRGDHEDRSSFDRDRDREYRSSRRDSNNRSSRDRDSKSSNNHKSSSDHRKKSSSRW